MGKLLKESQEKAMAKYLKMIVVKLLHTTRKHCFYLVKELFYGRFKFDAPRAETDTFFTPRQKAEGVLL